MTIQMYMHVHCVHNVIIILRHTISVIDHPPTTMGGAAHTLYVNMYMYMYPYKNAHYHTDNIHVHAHIQVHVHVHETLVHSFMLSLSSPYQVEMLCFALI